MRNNDEIYAQWKKYISGEIVIENIISNEVLESWKLCSNLDVHPLTRKEPNILTEQEIDIKVDQSGILIRTAIPVMEMLFNFMKRSGYLIALANSEGYLLRLIGDPNVIEEAKKGNFIKGACWKEENVGSNAVGSVLRTGSSMQVFASEHYCAVSHQWTCCGAPIYSPKGIIMGVISMIGPYYKYNKQSLGIVDAAAKVIENSFALQATLANPSDDSKSAKSSTGSIVIGTDSNLVVTMANKNIISAFGLQPRIIIGRTLEETFGPSNEPFVNLIKLDGFIEEREVQIYVGKTSKLYSLSTTQMESQEQYKPSKLIVLQEVERPLKHFTQKIAANKNYTGIFIIGENTMFLESLRLAEAASLSTSNVLLLGESGTGKEIFAHFIHKKGPKTAGPFIAVNCAAIPAQLIASELFGYEDGAFTGSKRGGNPGKFELAKGGTLLLDEIGEMPLELQTTLLRIIEEKQVTRIGGKRKIPLDIHIIAATNQELLSRVKEGKFRADLYYRLNVFTIRMIPLRERKDDISLFVHYFIEKLNREMGKRVEGVDDQFLNLLCQYDFPGNVRELINIIERAMNLTLTNTLTSDLLPAEIGSCSYMKNNENLEVPIKHMALKNEMDLLERMIISEIPKTVIAQKLNVSRSTLYRRLKKN